MTSMSPPQTSPLYTPRGKNLALLLLAMTQFVVVIDASIVNVALPSIGRALDFSRTDLSWVVNAYTLTFGGFLLLGGRMADLLGRRRMFMLGLVLFSLASFAGGIAQSEGWLLAARAAQGLGAAIVSPAALSIITVTFAEGAERNRALGIWGAVVGAGGAAGVLLGGILTSGLNWRWVLFVNVPIGIAAAALAPRTLFESRAGDGAGTRENQIKPPAVSSMPAIRTGLKPVRVTSREAAPAARMIPTASGRYETPVLIGE